MTFLTLYQDAHLLVVDKPAGLPVAPDRRGGPSVTALTGLHACHRLDEGTSGVLVLARTPAGLARVSEAFRAHLVEKVYRAVVVGQPVQDEGVIDLPLGDWKRGRVVVGRGRPARTRWRVVWRVGARAGLELRPHEGRTHQLRAHLSALGTPILGDDAYGAPVDERLWLHAATLSLPWPSDADCLVVSSPMSDGFDPG